MPVFQLKGMEQLAAVQMHALEDIERLQACQNLISETLKKIKESN